MKLVLLSAAMNPFSGWGRYTGEICTALQRKGVPFELHLPRDHAISSPSVAQGVEVYYDLPSFTTSFGPKLWRLSRFLRQHRRIRIEGDVIHSLTEFPYGISARFLAHQRGIPYGITLHGTYSVRPLTIVPDRWFFSRTLSEADFLIAVSHFTAHRTVSILGKPLEITTIPNGITFERFSESNTSHRGEAFLAAVGIPHDRPFLLSVGALKRRKGIDVLIRAFARVHEAEPSVCLLIVGSGDRRPYEGLVEDLGLRGTVFFSDPVDDDTLRELYHLCRFFVLLPREDGYCRFEGFGLVYLEASACGKAVVGSRSGGIPEAVREGETGLLVPPDDDEAAAQAMLSLIRNRERLAQLGAEGIRWAESHRWDRVIESYLTVYPMRGGPTVVV